MKILRQVWQSVRHNPLFSAIYVFGTALAIASATIFALLLYTKGAEVYPEYSRSRTVYVASVGVYEKTNDGYTQGLLSYPAVEHFIRPLHDLDVLTMILRSYGRNSVQSPFPDRMDTEVAPVYTDTEFFKIFSLDFLAGRPFSEEEFESGSPVAVISERLAEEVFGTEDYASLIGRDISLNNSKNRICGIYREGSPAHTASYTRIAIPYKSVDGWQKEWSNRPFVGNFEVVALTSDPEGAKKELRTLAERYNESQDKYTVRFFNQPATHSDISFTEKYEAIMNPVNLSQKILGTLGLLLVLLLVPALNMSGMISGQMERRMAEIAVRKSFGATRGRLLRDLLTENLVMTLAGGIWGYVLAIVMMQLGLATVFLERAEGSPAVSLTDDTAFAPAIFAFCFLVCCLLNVMSALIPAWRSLRKPIAESL